MKRKHLFLLCIFISLFLFYGCVSLDLKFKRHYCDDDIDPYTSPGAGIIRTEWVGEDTLSIRAYVSAYCTGAKIRGSYKLEENELKLFYEIIRGRSYSKCDCAHIVTYEISSLKRREYIITIQKKAK